jgi:hypothetical protein
MKGCQPCEQLKPIWTKAALAGAGELLFATLLVDRPELTSILPQQNIKMAPSVKIFRKVLTMRVRIASRVCAERYIAVGSD